MSRRRKPYSEDTEEPTLNLMPLIDVVFVVLVMFIVIAPMINLDRIELAEGAATVKQSQIDRTLQIQIRADNTYILNQRPLGLNELRALLVSAKKQYPHVIPQIMPDKKASFQAYENVRTAVKAAGFEQLDVNLSP